MATGAQTWSTTAASNNSIDTSVNWAEGQAPSSVNDSARAEMASAAMFIKDNAGTLATSGTTSAYTVTSKQVSTAATNGYTIAVCFHATNDSAATLNVDGIGAKALQLYNGTNVSGGEFAAGSIHRFTYISSSTAWVANDYFAQTVTLSADGTVGAPAYSFSGDTDSGLYRIGANNVGLALGGVKVTDVSTTTFAITDILTVSGAATLSSSLTVSGAALLSNTLTVSGAATLSSSMDVTGAANIGGAATIAGAATLSSSLAVSKATLFSSAVTISGGATLSSSLGVSGAAQFAAINATSATLSSSLNVSGATQVAALAASGAATLSSSLTVSNATLLSSNLTVSGTATLAAASVTGNVSAATISGSVVATQSDQETGTATTVVVTPGRQHYHPGMAKAWAKITAAGAVSASYNVTSATTGPQTFVVTWTNQFSSANYAVVATAFDTLTGMYAMVTAQTTGTATIDISSVPNTGFFVAAYGDM